MFFRCLGLPTAFFGAVCIQIGNVHRMLYNTEGFTENERMCTDRQISQNVVRHSRLYRKAMTTSVDASTQTALDAACKRFAVTISNLDRFSTSAFGMFMLGLWYLFTVMYDRHSM